MTEFALILSACGLSVVDAATVVDTAATITATTATATATTDTATTDAGVTDADTPASVAFLSRVRRSRGTACRQRSNVRSSPPESEFAHSFLRHPVS